MRCPTCGGKARVTKSKGPKGPDEPFRRWHVCQRCGGKFRSLEWSESTLADGGRARWEDVKRALGLGSVSGDA